jgi:hypothetical protein
MISTEAPKHSPTPRFVNLVIRGNCDRRLKRKSAGENAQPAQ